MMARKLYYLLSIYVIEMTTAAPLSWTVVVWWCGFSIGMSIATGVWTWLLFAAGGFCMGRGMGLWAAKKARANQ